jgi:hypothetical protein
MFYRLFKSPFNYLKNFFAGGNLHYLQYSFCDGVEFFSFILVFGDKLPL